MVLSIHKDRKRESLYQHIYNWHVTRRQALEKFSCAAQIWPSIWSCFIVTWMFIARRRLSYWQSDEVAIVCLGLLQGRRHWTQCHQYWDQGLMASSREMFCKESMDRLIRNHRRLSNHSLEELCFDFSCQFKLTTDLTVAYFLSRHLVYISSKTTPNVSHFVETYQRMFWLPWIFM